MPSSLLHLASQVVLRDSTATDYLDFVSGIVRSKRDSLEKRLSAYIRRNSIKGQIELQEFMKQRGDRLTAAFVEKVASLPIREGVLELNALGMTPEELVHRWKTELVGTADDSLDAFLKSKNA